MKGLLGEFHLPTTVLQIGLHRVAGGRQVDTLAMHDEHACEETTSRQPSIHERKILCATRMCGRGWIAPSQRPSQIGGQSPFVSYARHRTRGSRHCTGLPWISVRWISHA